jgi:hypothetical protein
MLVLHPPRAQRKDLALEHIKHTQDGDLILFDRNYPSYIFLASLTKLGRHFTGRCSKKSFKAARNMFKQRVTNSSIVTLKAPRFRQEKVPRIGTTRKNYSALC